MFGGGLIDFDFNTYDFDFWQPFLKFSLMVVKAAISLALFYGIEKFSSARKHTSYGHCLHFWNIFVMTIKAIQAFKISQETLGSFSQESKEFPVKSVRVSFEPRPVSQAEL